MALFTTGDKSVGLGVSQGSESVFLDLKNVQVGEASLSRGVKNDTIVDILATSEFYQSGRIFASTTKNEDFQYLALTPDIATIDSVGNITRVSEGVAKFVVQFGQPPRIRRKLITLDMNNVVEEAESVQQFSILPGSFAYHAKMEIENRINQNMTLENEGSLFTLFDLKSESFTRNPNFWGADIDLTGYSVNSNAGGVRTLITPRHMLGVTHWKKGVGTPAWFLGNDGVLHKRSVVARVDYSELTSEQNNFAQDQSVYVLDADLPSAVSPFQVFPYDDTAFDYGESFVTTAWMKGASTLAMSLNQDRYGLIKNWIIYGTLIPSEHSYLDRAIRLFDSGKPTVIILDGVAVLHLIFSSQAGGAPTFRSVDALNAMIELADAKVGISTGYTCTTYDTTVWPNFNIGNYLTETHDIANGNASVWVESGTLNGKKKYRKRINAKNFEDLEWGSGVWAVFPTINGIKQLDASESSSDDVVTPDLATFGTLNFEKP